MPQLGIRGGLGCQEEQEPLETNSGHVSATQCDRVLGSSIDGEIEAPVVPGLLEQPFSAVYHTLSKIRSIFGT